MWSTALNTVFEANQSLPLSHLSLSFSIPSVPAASWCGRNAETLDIVDFVNWGHRPGFLLSIYTAVVLWVITVLLFKSVTVLSLSYVSSGSCSVVFVGRNGKGRSCLSWLVKDIGCGTYFKGQPSAHPLFPRFKGIFQSVNDACQRWCLVTL